MSQEKRPGSGSGPVVDLFKLVKIQNVKPVGLERAPPQNWGEVWRQFNHSMMRIVAGIPTFAVEAIEGMTRAVRGATMPEKVEQKVFRAYAECDMQEEDLQAQYFSQDLLGQGVLPTADEAERRLMEILQRFQTEGQKVNAQLRDDGTIVIGIVRPELEDAAINAVKTLPDRVKAPDKEPVKS